MTVSFNINDFKAKLNQGLLRNNKFTLQLLTIPYGMQGAPLQTLKEIYPDLLLYCESVDIPGSLIWMNKVNRYGYGAIEQKPYQPAFSDCRAVFRSDQDGKVFRFLRAWQNLAINYRFEETDTITSNTNISNFGTGGRNMTPYEIGYKKQYAVDVEITSYREDGTPIQGVVLRDAFPSVIAETSLAWGVTRTYAQLPVAIVFTDLYLKSYGSGH